jgi:hypothetical protein
VVSDQTPKKIKKNNIFFFKKDEETFQKTVAYFLQR